MLLQLCLITTLSTVLCSTENSIRTLDFTEVCSKSGDYHLWKFGDYCTHFNKTCSKMFESKGVCESMELKCDEDGEKCVLHGCKEYTGRVQYLPPNVNEHKTEWSYRDETVYCSPIAEKNIEGTNYCGRFNFWCLRNFEDAQNDYGNVCFKKAPTCEQDVADEHKGKGNCELVKCTENERTPENHPVDPVGYWTIRTTPVSRTDIDETKYAADYALMFGNERNYCEVFYEGCRWVWTAARIKHKRNYKIKENFCVTQRTGGVPQGACILQEEPSWMDGLLSLPGRKYSGTL